MAVFFIKEAVFSIKVAFFFIKEAVFSIKVAFFSIKEGVAVVVFWLKVASSFAVFKCKYVLLAFN